MIPTIRRRMLMTPIEETPAAPRYVQFTASGTFIGTNYGLKEGDKVKVLCIMRGAKNMLPAVKGLTIGNFGEGGGGGDTGIGWGAGGGGNGGDGGDLGEPGSSGERGFVAGDKAEGVLELDSTTMITVKMATAETSATVNALRLIKATKFQKIKGDGGLGWGSPPENTGGGGGGGGAGGAGWIIDYVNKTATLAPQHNPINGGKGGLDYYAQGGIGAPNNTGEGHVYEHATKAVVVIWLDPVQ